jgi:hypothetical protein
VQRRAARGASPLWCHETASHSPNATPSAGPSVRTERSLDITQRLVAFAPRQKFARLDTPTVMSVGHRRRLRAYPNRPLARQVIRARARWSIAR